MQKISFWQFLVLAVGFISLTACEQEMIFPPDEIANPTIQKQEDELPTFSEDNPLLDTCPPSYPISASYQTYPTESRPLYNFMVQIIPGSFTPRPGCPCKRMEYCLTVILPQSSVQSAAISESTAPESPITILEADDDGGYIGYQPSVYSRPQNAPPNSFTVCTTAAANSSVLLFNINQSFPPSFDFSSLVWSVSGICIIDDISSGDD